MSREGGPTILADNAFYHFEDVLVSSRRLRNESPWWEVTFPTGLGCSRAIRRGILRAFDANTGQLLSDPRFDAVPRPGDSSDESETWGDGSAES